MTTPDQVGMSHLGFEEQACEVGAEDHVQPDRLGEQPHGDCCEQDEGEALAAFRAERQAEPWIDDASDHHRDAEEQDHLPHGDRDVHRLEAAPREHADDQPEEDQRQQVIDHAAGHDDAGQPRVGQPQVLEALQRDHHRRGGHGQPDERCSRPGQGRKR